MFYVTQDVQHRFELDLNLKVFRNLNMDHSNKGYVKIYARTVCKKISWQEMYLKKNNLSALLNIAWKIVYIYFFLKEKWFAYFAW